MKKETQSDWVKTALRLPPDLHAQLKDSAEESGASLNAEIVARLQVKPPEERLQRLEEKLDKLTSMVHDIIYAIGPRKR